MLIGQNIHINTDKVRTEEGTQTTGETVRMEHKFDSLRERWHTRKGIKWLLTMI